MQLSVIILNYNVRYFLEQCIISVKAATANLDAEIIVVDNNSEDDSCEMVKQRFPEIRLVENNENTGFPKGNNIGVNLAKGEYICILNPDTVVAEDTFEKVLAFAKNQPNLGIVGVRLIDGTGNFLPESKRGTPTPFVAFTKIAGLHKLSPALFGKYYASHLDENQTGNVDILVGAFMVMKRELYLEIGGFDENCFMYSDDIDLSYSVLKSGRQNFYFSDTTVIHYKGESTVKDATYINRFREAMNYFYKKHFKVSAIFDVAMRTGAFVFSAYKAKSGKKPPHRKEDYILVSDNENLQLQVENLLGKKMLGVTKAEQNSINSLVTANVNTEIIFDNNELSYKWIVEKMFEWKRPNVTFRIIPLDSKFLIGSDSSDGRGEILKLKQLGFSSPNSC